MDLQENPVGIPHQITPGNLLMLAKNEAVPFDTRVEATLRLYQELPFVPDHLRGKYAAEISAIRAHLGVGEIPKEASDLGIADEFAKLLAQFEDLTARVDKLEAIVLDLATPKRFAPAAISTPENMAEVARVVASAKELLKRSDGQPSTGFEDILATALTVENGIVTKVV